MKRVLATLVLFALALARAVAPAAADQRVTWYFGQQVNSNTLNTQERAHRLSVGQELLALFGANGGYQGLTITPTTGLYVDVQPSMTNVNGAVYQLGADDVTAWGGGTLGPSSALSADPTQVLLQAIVSQATTPIGPLSVPSTSGQSQVTLVECYVTPVDATPIAATFITSLGSVTQQTVNRDRDDTISCQGKAGTASTTPTIPTADTGYVGIGYITVPYGTTTIVPSMVSGNAQIQPNVTRFALAPGSIAAPNQFNLNPPIIVNGYDNSSYSTGSGEIVGPYNPAIQSTIQQNNTGIPTSGYFSTYSNFGSNSATIGNDSSINGLIVVGDLGASANNNILNGLQIQSLDSSPTTGHATSSGDAYQNTVNAVTYNLSNDPSSSSFCGTYDCLQGSQRQGILSFNKGAYPLSAAFRNEFSSVAGNADSHGDRPYIGYLSDDTAWADFVSCDPAFLTHQFPGAHCVSTYGFLANANGIATSGVAHPSTTLGFRTSTWNGSTSAFNALTENFQPLSNATNTHNAFVTQYNGAPLQRTYDDGEFELAPNSSGVLFETYGSSGSLAITSNVAAQHESDLYSNYTDATTSDRAFSLRAFNGGTDSELASLTRAGLLYAAGGLSGPSLTLGSSNGCLSATSGAVTAGTCYTGTVTGLTAGSNVVVGTGAAPSVAVTAAPSFTGTVTGGNLTDSALTSGRCVQASTAGLLANAAAGCVTSVSAGGSGNVVVAGTASAPTVDVTAAPSFSSVTTSMLTSTGAFYQGTASSTNNVTNTLAQISQSLAAFAVNAASSSSLSATAYNFYNNGSSPSYSGSVLSYYGTGYVGTIAGLSYANLGSLIFQNTSGGMIATNGNVPITIAPNENSAYATTFGATGSVTMSGALSGATSGTFSSVLKSASVAAGTQSYVAPMYTSAGVAVASTMHGVQYSCTFAAGTSCAVTLTGASTGQFASATSYSCGAPDMGTSTTPIAFVVGNKTATSFTVYALTSNSDTVYGTCWGT